MKNPHFNKKPNFFQHVPKTPDFTKEREAALKYEGLPPLEAKKANTDVVMFTNVNSVFLRHGEKVRESFSAARDGDNGVVVVKFGVVSCVGTAFDCSVEEYGSDAQIIDLEGGSIS